MQIVVITFAIGVLLSWFFLRKQTPRPDAPFRAAMKYEIKGWLITLGIMTALLFIVLLFTLLFGPLRPLHEW